MQLISSFFFAIPAGFCFSVLCCREALAEFHGVTFRGNYDSPKTTFMNTDTARRHVRSIVDETLTEDVSATLCQDESFLREEVDRLFASLPAELVQPHEAEIVFQDLEAYTVNLRERLAERFPRQLQ